MTKGSSICLAMFFVLSRGELHAQLDNSKELKAKLQIEWASLYSKINTVRCEETIESYKSRDGKPLSRNRKDVRQLAGNQNCNLQLIDAEYYDEAGAVKERRHSMEIANASYRAALSRPKAGQGWLLNQFEGGKDEAQFNRGRFVNALPWLLLFDHGVVASEWIQDQRFVITKSETISTGTEGATLRVHFTSKMPGDSKVGFIDFDPLHFHRIVGYKCFVTTKFSESDRKGRMDYENGNDIPVLKTMTEETPVIKSDKFGPMSAKRISSYKIKYNVEMPDDEFRLPYYGIPEPGGPAKKSFPTYLWILCAAAASVAAAFVLRYMRRRRAAKA